MRRCHVQFVLILVSIAVLTIFYAVDRLGAASKDAQTQLDALETRTDEVAEQRRRVKEELEKIDRLNVVAAAWFAKMNQAETEIREIEKQRQDGGSNIYEKQQLEYQLEVLRKKYDGIMRLDGGQVIDGVAYASLYQLQEETRRRNSDALQLNKDYMRLSQELRTLDQERDRLLPKAQDARKSRLEFARYRLSCLEDELEVMQKVVTDDDLWVPKEAIEFSTIPPYMSRARAIATITDHYLLSLQTTPGKKPDMQEVSAQIKQLQSDSEAIKRIMRDRIIPEKIKEIEALQREIQELETGSAEIQGCWVILIGSETYPVIQITRNAQGDYEATFTHVGQLDFFKRGDRLFSVAQINEDTYDGTEYSFNPAGRPVKVALRVILNRDGKSMIYRSDSLFTLRRCD